MLALAERRKHSPRACSLILGFVAKKNTERGGRPLSWHFREALLPSPHSKQEEQTETWGIFLGRCVVELMNVWSAGP